MNSLASSTASQNTESARALRAAILAHLRETQNADGGWSFLSGEDHARGDSRVEPTCWALRALADSPESAPAHLTRGIAFLKLQQISDGSWPAATGMSSGGWVTSLATSVLAQFPSNEKPVYAGLQWLCDDYPRDSSPWQKILKSFSSNKHASHNDEFRGWGWTPRTSSWVEPTAFALMAFLSAPDLSSAAQLAKSIHDRRTLAIGLLYDRMCAGGGWNCGNPRVYGVDGDSLILSTCWALLALRDAPEHPNRELSLSWLQKSFATIASPGSLALAQITLETYGAPLPAAQHHLTDWSAEDLTDQGTHVASWVSLALNLSRSWPAKIYRSPATSHQSPQ
jgi:Squalene-hopene cyclase C-terminal domain